MRLWPVISGFSELGVGLSVPELNSHMPYVMLSAYLRARILCGISRFRYAKWANQSQDFFPHVTWARSLTSAQVFQNLHIEP